MAGPIDVATILEVLTQLAAVLRKSVSDPAKDRQRIGRLDAAFALAKAGDETPRPELDNKSGRDYIEEIATNAPVPGGGTAGGSKVAVAYAHVKHLELLVAALEKSGELPPA